MKTKLTALAIVIAAAIGAFSLSDSSRAQQQPAAPAGPPPAPVEIAAAAEADFAPVQWVPGTVISREDARVASEQSGRLVAIAEVGDEIAANGVLAQLDDEALTLSAREAEAALSRIASQLAYQQRQVDRLQTLKSNSSIAETQLDEARSQLDMLRHDHSRAEITLAEARRRLRDATIRAPFAGVVAERVAQRGEYVNAGAVVVRLVNTAHLEVSARAPVALGSGLRPGASVTVKGDHRDETDTIRAVVPVGDPQSRQLEVRVAVADGTWPIGAAVQVALPVGDAAPVVAVPRDALILRGSETFVYRVAADNKAERIQVETGNANGDLIEIRGGIAAGDRLVIRGGERLQPGQSVAIKSS